MLPVVLPACFSNNPYRPSEAGRNTYYDTFAEEPKHFDPAVAYSTDCGTFVNQIYEPVVQYHYLKRPYVLVPLTAERVPEPTLFDAHGEVLTGDPPAEAVARAVYEIRLKPGILYQNHPCFAKTPDGRYRWHLAPGESFPRKIEHPDDLGASGTREVRAEDYVYEIKRLAHPILECPIAAVMANYIEGFADFKNTLTAELSRIRAERRRAAGAFYNQEADERANPIYLDPRKYDLRGVQVVDALTYRVTLKRKYPQFVYWLAMTFFAPVPWEADRFYTQSAAGEQNITLERFPVGSGPFVLAVNRPNYRMVMRRNPNYHLETYPAEGAPGDEEKGLLADRGRRLPFLDEAVYVLEKEGVPRWNKFLQGYYDGSGIGSDMFDQAVQFNTEGAVGLTESLRAQNIRLETAVAMTTHMYVFNMLDDVVGGYDLKKRKLRQALSIALNQEEHIQIFGNGRGVPAQSPIPPGIFGYQEGREGINPVVYEWDEAANAPRRKSLAAARRLLAEAGYPNGRDAAGNPLIVFYDTTSGGPGSKAYLDWLRKQFDSIGVQLQVRSTDYNRFQEKLLKGNFQFLSGGWLADYPDPENFLFLLYAPNGKLRSQGENAANYDNPRFNELFRKMENMTNSPERLAIIREMLSVAREDAPWIWGYHPIDYGLYHEWHRNAKPMAFAFNTLKYKRIEPQLREQRRAEWNEPITWPLWIGLAVLIAGAIPAAIVVYRREKGVART
ncbi:MAG: ABC transporter substrate-binding protein [Planctomycetota bacterium]|nr:ABC transporter substrate-binding protein [Planctomycetota bacterium]